MIKVNPGLALSRQLSLGGFIVFGICLLSLFAPYLVFKAWGSPSLHAAYYDIVILLALISLVAAITSTTLIAPVKRLEQKRQRAARGDSTLLAQTQPSPNEHALNLPFTLGFRYQSSVLRRNILTFLLFLVIITGIIIMGIITGGSLPASDFPVFSSEIIPFITPMLIIIDIFFLIFLGHHLIVLARGKPGNQLVVTQDELIVSKKHRVAWKDARLFAIISIGSRNTLSNPLIFEVASADSLVRINWLHAENAQKRAVGPLTSFEEYDRQMHALLSVIAAKTGLPLYDLRKQ